MSKLDDQRAWLREELFQLLAVSGILAGFCVTGVALFRTQAASSMPATIADNLLAFSALAFLLCIGIIFLGVRRNTLAGLRALDIAVDIIFTSGVAGMVGRVS